ncbi:MAG: YggS family pyridoxal phosphate-dependent enzyme [Polyangia bacterium]
MSIADALAEVRQKVADAAQGRRVQLVAVSKTVDATRVNEARAAGQLVFGENYAQELRDKAPLVIGAQWHFIGPLQRNKVKYVVGVASLIHGVDSSGLAQEIASRARSVGIVQPCLVQVNVANEPQKSGCLPTELPSLLDSMRAAPSLRVDGLMCIPPAERDPRPHFAQLRELASQHDLAELSMGMSADYEAAIEEGATLVRVGSAIFGRRG